MIARKNIEQVDAKSAPPSSCRPRSADRNQTKHRTYAADAPTPAVGEQQARCKTLFGVSLQRQRGGAVLVCAR
eukprot:364081-Chlamydomonas_euryale.AAC.5